MSVKPRAQSWIVCETTGRWAAALRVALKRFQAARTGTVTPRTREARGLAELEASIGTTGATVGFVEVRSDNLAAILELFAKSARRNLHFVALLGDELGRPPEIGNARPTSRQSVADVLTEAGALCVINSPRQIGAAIEIAMQYCTVHTAATVGTGDSESLAERAWAALPWQDA